MSLKCTRCGAPYISPKQVNKILAACACGGQSFSGTFEYSQPYESLLAERDVLREKVRVLREALSAMLTHMGMDEDEWNKPTYDQARAALEATKA
jgi:hypothetical protein